MPAVQTQKVKNVSFGIKISPSLLEAADEFYCGVNHSQEEFDRFYRKAKYMEENYGFDDYEIVLKKFYKKGKPKTGIYAVRGEGYNKKEIVLTVKDNVRKALEKFLHINVHELNTKIGDYELNGIVRRY